MVVGYPGHITRTFFDPVDKLAVAVPDQRDRRAGAGDGNGTLFRLIDLAQSRCRRTSRRDSDGGEGGDRGPVVVLRRFANLWGVFDIVELGGRLFQIDPTAPDPATEPVHLEVIDSDTLRIRKTSGYGSPGESFEFERDDDGVVRSVRGGSASTSHPIDAFTAALNRRDRVTLGAPIAPIAPRSVRCIYPGFVTNHSEPGQSEPGRSEPGAPEAGEEAPYGAPTESNESLKRVRTRHFLRAKENGIKITGLTSYDFLSASIFDRAGIDFLLVGDSARQRRVRIRLDASGHESTS
jgi:hypothetical protein